MSKKEESWLSKDGFLLSLSAFFADLGYQGVTALYPLFIVLELHKSPLLYGLIAGIGFGIGSLFAFVGGHLGDHIDQKKLLIIGNLGILFLALSGSFSSIWLSGLSFVFGWWFRYLRTPARRALLVKVTKPENRIKTFGFLHALDIGGGLISIIVAIIFLLLHVKIGSLIQFSAIPLIISSAVLLPVGKSKLYKVQQEKTNTQSNKKPIETNSPSNNKFFLAIIIATGLYGLSFYNLGFPVLSAATISRYAVAGLIAYGLYLGVSSVSGWLLGLANLQGLRPLWQWGYLSSAFASLIIAISYIMHGSLWAIYPAVAILGIGMGAVETYEPAITATLRSDQNISSGMGWLSASRGIGQFGANLIMGALFVAGEAYAYGFAALAALMAAIILAVTQFKSKKS